MDQRLETGDGATGERRGVGIEARELDYARVAGKTEAVAVYELMALKGQLSTAQEKVVARYAEALALYRESRFAEAQKPLQEALQLIPSDGPAKALLKRCEKFVEHAPSMPFDGVIDLDK